MKWSKELPKKEGFYWLRTETFFKGKLFKEIRIVEVRKKINCNNEFYYCATGDCLDNCDDVSNVKYYDKVLWYGPLKEPERDE